MRFRNYLPTSAFLQHIYKRQVKSAFYLTLLTSFSRYDIYVKPAERCCMLLWMSSISSYFEILKMLSKLSFIIANTACIILKQDRGRTNVQRKRQKNLEILHTQQIHLGLRSQMTSAIITNYHRSPGNTSPM